MRLTELDALVAAAAGAEGVFRESVSMLSSPEPLVLDLASPATTAPARDDIVAAARVLRHLPAPTVLIGSPATTPPELADAADVCLTADADADPDPDPPRPWIGNTVSGPVDDALAVLTKTVAAQPTASLALVVLLRTTEHADIWSAIAGESATYALLLGSAGFQQWLHERGPGHPKGHVRPPVAADIVSGTDRATLRIVLDRPEARNAIDTATRDALVEALAIAEADRSLGVELRGRGQSFSAGGDLQEFGLVGDPGVAHAVRLTRHPGASVAAVADRTTCYLHGPCVGAGIEMTAFATRLVADPGATFRLPEVTMGLVPGAGGTVSVPRRVGRQRAAWMALTGAPIDAATALRWGLVDRLEPVSGE